MRRELLMPKLGLTMTEGMVADWVVQAGQSFASGDTLFVVETDKVANEIPAEGTGTLLEVVVPPGDTVPVSTVIAYWDDGQPDVVGEKQATTLTEPSSATGHIHSVTVAPTAPATIADAPHIIATPHARRLARQRDIALDTLQGSGPRGRIVARDVESVQTGVPTHAAATHAQDESAYMLRTPTALQTTIARRMVKSKQDTPHFYLALDADVSRLVNLRKEMNAVNPGHHLTYTHFVVMAVARALARLPQINSVWQDDGILTFQRIDVGIAVDTQFGLLAPAVTDIGDLSITELSRRLDAVAERARANKLIPTDTGNPAITVSNAGMHNVTYMSSIINPGQAMILGVGGIKDVFRPDEHDVPVLKREMGLVLSADHRVMDGVGALRFFNAIVDFLQEPIRLLMRDNTQIAIGE